MPISSVSFNPRTREGATRRPRRSSCLPSVSIHAPVRVRRPEAQGLKVRGPNGVLRQPVQSSCALQVVMMSGSFVNLRASMTYRVASFPAIFCELGVGARGPQQKGHARIVSCSCHDRFVHSQVVCRHASHSLGERPEASSNTTVIPGLSFIRIPGSFFQDSPGICPQSFQG